MAGPADQRRQPGTGPRIHIGPDLQQPVGDHRLALALQLERLQRFGNHRLTHQCPRLRADHDLSRGGRLLQPRRQIHRISGRQPLLGAGHHLPGVHPRAHAHRRAEVGLQCPVECLDLLAQPDRGPHRPQRIILVQHGHTEHRHHRVPDELLHRAAVPSDHRPRGIEIPVHHLPEALQVQPLPQSRRPGHVAKKHRHRLALLPRSRTSHQGCAAPIAEPGIRRVLPPTPSAHLHTRRLSPSSRDTAFRRTFPCHRHHRPEPAQQA